MERKYNEVLVRNLKEKIVMEEWKGTKVIYKRLPDSNEEGAMDPRLYEDSKKMMRMLKFIPKGMIKMDTSEKGLASLRETFNGIKSIPIVESGVDTKEYKVIVKDGTELSLYRYTTEKTDENSPVLYYMHGGGFFAGHHGVVEQSLKLMCQKFDFNIFSVDYRLAPENPYPIGHNDCYDVLK